MDNDILLRYESNKDSLARLFYIHHKDKKRTIVSYKETDEGQEFKAFHEKLLLKLNRLPSSKNSFAYKLDSNTSKALTNHIGSKLFIKLDIHNYFESITKEDLVKRNSKYFDEIGLKEEELNSCFYFDHLSLGYVTSPKLSDIYLYDVDKKIEEYLEIHPTLKYSRYSDDILISTSEENFASLHTFEGYIIKLLNELSLEINEAKRREFDLTVITSVHFLGLNMSIKDNKYVITLSKKFIVQTLDLLETAYKLSKFINEYELAREKDILNGSNIYLKKKEIQEYKDKKGYLRYLKGKIKSRVGYIKFNSELSYNKFLKKHLNKFGFEWGEKWL